jgi:hypothetical protein
LKANQVYYKSADSKTVLLAKYKVLFSEKQGNAQRYALRQCPTQSNQGSVNVRPVVNSSIPDSSHANVQPNVPSPEIQPNATSHDAPLLDMNDCNTMESIQPLVPAQPPELCRSISAFSRQPEPVDDPRVSNWASDVRMATSDNNQSASANRDINQATIGSPSIEALASALNLFAQGSLQIGSASHNTMKIIAENLISLNSAIANLSLDNVVNMQSSPSLRAPATRRSGRQRSQATYDNNMDVDTPAIRPRGSRNVEIQVSFPDQSS